MDQQQSKMSSLEKLQQAIKILEIQYEEIMATGTIVPQIWDNYFNQTYWETYAQQQ
jgi:hypothetical protein